MSKKEGVMRIQVSENGVITNSNNEEISDSGFMTIEVPTTASYDKVRNLLKDVSLSLENIKVGEFFGTEDLAEIDFQLPILIEAITNAFIEVKHREIMNKMVKEQLYKNNYVYNEDDDLSFLF